MLGKGVAVIVEQEMKAVAGNPKVAVTSCCVAAKTGMAWFKGFLSVVDPVSS